MIPLNEALKKAIEHFKAAVPDVKNVRIEEIDHDPEAGEWLITVGYSTEYVAINPEHSMGLGGRLGERGSSGYLDEVPRAYRMLHLSDETGDFKKMRMR